MVPIAISSRQPTKQDTALFMVTSDAESVFDECSPRHPAWTYTSGKREEYLIPGKATLSGAFDVSSAIQVYSTK